MTLNILLFLMMITMACVGYASAYKIMQREIVERDIQLHMAYTFIEKRLSDRQRKTRVRTT
jgi:hypothetical protein